MRIYFDENFSPHLVAGMQALQQGRKGDDIEVFSNVDEFGRGAPDEDWIPKVAARHGIAFTQDVNIHRYPALWELCKANKIGIIFLKPPKKENWNYWSIAAFVISKWPEIQKCAKEQPRPFGYVLEFSTGKLKKI